MTPAAAKRSRRELTAAVVLAVAGGALLLFIASRGWVGLRVDRKAPLPPLHRTIDGSDAQPLLYALGLVGLAGAVAILATRRIGRIVVGVLLVATGAVALQRTISDLNGLSPGHVLSLLEDAGPVVGVPRGAHTVVDPHLGWMIAALVAAALLGTAGLATIVRAGSWPMMGKRYERAERRSAAVTDRNLWDAMDRGEDLTAGDGAPGGDHAEDRTR
ncbi:MAG TPA: Trp biosynthesis-associated membrane protein [Mycobacteriales bacterium]|nr:Trp biosynthesis-associated membrane protein [Mycobacteriales bacterium]